MKRIFRKASYGTAVVGIAATLSLGAGSLVHAQTVTTDSKAPVTLAFAFPSLQGIFGSRIQDDRINASNNRDERNALLEAKAKPAQSPQTQSTTTETEALSLSLSELQNIQSRIYARAADAAAQGDDVSTVTGPLTDAGNELDMASSSIAAMDQAGGGEASTTEAISAAKESLEEALEALKTIVGN